MKKLFEVSWEVCNKVGGIYTVIVSKAPYVKEHIKDHYFVGPYFEGKKYFEFDEKPVPSDLKTAFDSMESKGIKCHYGEWLKTKTPAILIDFKNLMNSKNDIKKRLWEDYHIDSMNSGSDFEDPIVWSYAVGIFLDEVSKSETEKKIVGQFHEWLTGAGILYLKKNNPNIATVFTTHATVLERAMAGSGEFFMGGDANAKSYELNVNDKHQIERESALNCDIFTAVSKTVSNSCERVFGRKPEVIVLNGTDMRNFPDMEEIPNLHKKNKEQIKDFVMSYFFPYYYFDIENTLFYFLSGRYELYAKGVDIYIKALGELNHRLKAEKDSKNVVAFIFIPTATKGEDIKILESIIFLKSLKEKVEDYSDVINRNTLYSFLSQKKKPIFDESFVASMKKLSRIFEKEGNPPITTHILENPNDAIIQEIKKAGLENKEDDKVKIIFYPAYLGENDGLLDMAYYDVLNGCHLGVFPSFYEPWGYTPIESAVYGVPSITTDLSGVGQYVKENLRTNKPDEKGIIVIEREKKTDDESTKELEEWMHWYAHLPKIQRIKNKIVAETFSTRVSWEHLVKNYLEAYNLAVEKISGKSEPKENKEPQENENSN